MKKTLLEEKIENAEKVLSRAMNIEIILVIFGLICLFSSIWVQQYSHQLVITGIFFWVIIIPFYFGIQDLKEELYYLKKGNKK